MLHYFQCFDHLRCYRYIIVVPFQRDILCNLLNIQRIPKRNLGRCISGDVLSRYMDQYAESDCEKVDLIKEEFIKFLLLAHQSDNAYLLFSKDIQNFWSVFASSFKKEYEDFYKKLPQY